MSRRLCRPLGHSAWGPAGRLYALASVAALTAMALTPGAATAQGAQRVGVQAEPAQAPDTLTPNPNEPKTSAPSITKSGMFGASQGASPQYINGSNTINPGQPLPAPYPAANDLVQESLDKVSPMTPDEIRRFRKEYADRTAALSESVAGYPAPEPVTSVYTLDISPGATPPVVRVSPGQGSIVSFLDAAGRPWPAKLADNFAPKGIKVTAFSEHQLSISTLVNTPVNGGVAVSLQGLPVAVTFNVITGQSKVDSQVNMLLPRYLDNQAPGVGAIKGEPALPVGDLMAFLLRTPPSSARTLTVSGLPGALAWQTASGRMVLRTSALVASGFFRSQGLGDGTQVYEMPLSQVVRVIQGDLMKSVQISDIQTGAAQ